MFNRSLLQQSFFAITWGRLVRQHSVRTALSDAVDDVVSDSPQKGTIGWMIIAHRRNSDRTVAPSVSAKSSITYSTGGRTHRVRYRLAPAASAHRRRCARRRKPPRRLTNRGVQIGRVLPVNAQRTTAARETLRTCVGSRLISAACIYVVRGVRVYVCIDEVCAIVVWATATRRVTPRRPRAEALTARKAGGLVRLQLCEALGRQAVRILPGQCARLGQSGLAGRSGIAWPACRPATDAV